MEIVAEITKLPPAVVEYAHGQTVQMLYGLSDEQIDTLVVQLKLIKETGFLKSDVWDNPDRIKKEFFLGVRPERTRRSQIHLAVDAWGLRVAPAAIRGSTPAHVIQSITAARFPPGTR